MTTGDGSTGGLRAQCVFHIAGIMTFYSLTGIICTSLGLHVAINIIIALVLGFLW